MYVSFTHGIPPEAEPLFNLPNKWPSYCGNANAGKQANSASNLSLIKSLYFNVFLGFSVEPMRGFVVTPDGQDHFELTSGSPPVGSLGEEIHVNFKAQPNWYYNATQCAKFNTIVFNRDNWNKPQKVDMSFKEYGCCTYAITATGGGYEWQYTISTFAVYACDGTAGYGCNGKSPCGG